MPFMGRGQGAGRLLFAKAQNNKWKNSQSNYHTEKSNILLFKIYDYYKNKGDKKLIKLRVLDSGKKIKTLAVPVCEDREIHENREIALLNRKAKKIPEFSGKKDEEITLYDLPEACAERIIFMGLGKVDKLDGEALRSFCGKAIKKCLKNSLKNASLAAPASKKTGLETRVILESMMQGACRGNDIFDKYKEKKELFPLKRIDLIVSSEQEKKYKKLALRTEMICDGTVLAREWTNTPSNHKQPAKFAKAISAKAAKTGNLNIIAFDEKDLRKKEMNALLAVSQGSRNKPRMVILEYRHEKAKKNVALIGKGVTFDSGGINLKPTGSLEDMKIDMSGAAAVAATLITIAKLKPAINVAGIIPLVENMPSGTSTRPGDIVKSLSGKTVEILNTDAEGRLILIDAMSYAEKEYRPDIMVDIATLTGACVVALGEKIAGIFSNDDRLADAIIAAGKKNHEPCWKMPMHDDYKELLKSELADIRNVSSSRWGGAITAALFLSEFVKTKRWAHIDIAGPASAKKGSAYCEAGGTGFGIRLFCDLLEEDI